MGRTPGRSLATVVQVVLAAILVASHLVSTAPYYYPHYVLLILGHQPALRRVGIRLAPWQSLWIATALFLHPMGGLFGLYRSVWWFDHLTHAMSATLVAAIGFTTARAYRRLGGGPGWVVPAFTIAFVVVAGLLWELLETYTPLLTVYGPNDTLWDHVFNLLGGVVVAVWGPRFLDDAATGLAARFEPSVGAEDVSADDPT